MPPWRWQSLVKCARLRALSLSGCAGSNPVLHITTMKGTTNPELQSLIFELKKRSLETKVDMWKKVASDLSRSQKNKRVVNLTKISKYAGKDETIVVPGKVLADGEITGKLKIAAYTYSTPALDKLKKAGAETLTLQELLASNPDPKKIRIIG